MTTAENDSTRRSCSCDGPSKPHNHTKEMKMQNKDYRRLATTGEHYDPTVDEEHPDFGFWMGVER